MAVNTTEITNVYNSLFTAMIAKYDTMWSSNEIDAETYAQLVGQASSQLVQLAADLVQKQEALDKDNLLKDKQLEIAEQERLAKVFEVTNLLPEQLIKLQEEVDLLQTQDLTALYEKDFILPAQLLKIQKDTDVTERGMVEQEATGAAQRTILATEEQAKQYEVDNLLPEQLIKLQEEIDLLQTQDLSAAEQIKAIYADRVLKDKQAAKLGLDNTMKRAEASRTSDPNYVYTPYYETL